MPWNKNHFPESIEAAIASTKNYKGEISHVHSQSLALGLVFEEHN